MKQSMGQIIRQLRKERNLTQEELAEQLNVTYQAVSRWENETGMPDISQVIPLANVFGVSTDVLFGTKNLDHDAEIERIIEEASAPQRLNYETEEEQFQVSVKEYETYIEALKTYPNNIKLLYIALASGYNLSVDYLERGNKQKATELRRECIRQGNVILNTCNDLTRLLDTHNWLVVVYSALGDFESAEEHANRMPHRLGKVSGMLTAEIKSSKGDVDGAITQHCINIEEILDLMEIEVLNLGNAYYYKKQYEDAIRVYKLLSDIIPVIYEKDEYTPPYHTTTVGDHIARCCIKLGRYDEAIEWLWKDFEHLCKNAVHYNVKEQLETPLLRECTFRFFGESLSVKRNMGYLNRSEFNVLHDYPRYKELILKLSNMD